MFGLFLSWSGLIQEIPILLDEVNVNFPALLGFDALTDKYLFLGHVTRHLRNHVVANEHSLLYENRWKMKMI